MTDALTELRRRLAECDGNQRELARRLGIKNPADVNRWLKGKRPISRSGLEKLGLQRVERVTYKRL